MTAGTTFASIASRAPGPTIAYVVQGEQRVTDDDGVVFSTILGSCVAACLRDPLSGVGGMNHFLLPGEMDGPVPDLSSGQRMGVHAMEVLLNALFARGASRQRLEAKIFGGACLNSALARIGSLNAAFVTRFLQREGIAVVGACLGGRLGRRVQFWPVSGRARRIFLPASDLPAPVATVVPLPVPGGALELF